jgi:hypothetical protein
MVGVTAAAWLVIALLVAGGWVYYSTVGRYPFRRCPRCNGAKKNAGSNELRWGLCGRCGGKGYVRRFGAGPGPEPPRGE